MITEESVRLILKAEMDQYVAAIKRAEQEAKRLGSTWEENAVKIKEIGNRLSVFVSVPLAAAAGISIKTAAAYETQRIAFGVLVGDMQKGQEVFEANKKLAASTPLSIEAINDATQTLMGFNATGVNTQDTLRKLGDVAMGKADKLRSISLAYGQMAGAGRANMQDLLQLVNAGVPILGALAEQFGVSTGEIREMVAEGKIGFADVDKALTTMTSEGGLFHKMMEKMSQTAEGKLSTALDNLKEAGANAFEKMIPLIKSALDTVSSLAQGFSEMDEGAQKTILTIIGISAATGPIMQVAGSVKAVGKALEFVNTGITGLTAGLAGLAVTAAALLANELIRRALAPVGQRDGVEVRGLSPAERDAIVAKQTPAVLKFLESLDPRASTEEVLKKLIAWKDQNAILDDTIRSVLGDSAINRRNQSGQVIGRGNFVGYDSSAVDADSLTRTIDLLKKFNDATRAGNFSAQLQNETLTASSSEAFNRALEEYIAKREALQEATNFGFFTPMEREARFAALAREFVEETMLYGNLSAKQVAQIKDIQRIYTAQIPKTSILQTLYEEADTEGSEELAQILKSETQRLEEELRKRQEAISNFRSATESALGPIGGAFARLFGPSMTNEALAEWNTFFNEASGGFHSLQSAITNTYDLWVEAGLRAMETQINALEKTLDAYERSTERQMKFMEDHGQDTVEYELEVAKEKERIDEEIARKKAELERKQFEMDKNKTLGQIAMATAVGIAQAATPATWWMIPVIAALGATQAGLVMAQQPPQLYDGGIVSGSSAGILANIGERGQSEAVIPLRREKLAELGIGKSSSVSITINGATNSRETARELEATLRKMQREGVL